MFLNRHLLILTFVLCMKDGFYSFTVEEMKYLNYEVDIEVSPVKKEETSQPVIYLSSKSGQEFQCVLPQLSEDEISEKEVTNEKDEDVLELLKPMKSGPCLSKSKDWWTYEFCFGHYIKQFHLEDGQIIGQVLTLGLYESDYDWNNDTNQEKFKHAKQRYHSQYYTNGTKCDLTGQPRNAEVRIYCEEDAGDYIYRVDEPGTCSYVITIHTSRLCSHPLLKPLPSNKAHLIPCHPVLNDEQYSNYEKKLKEQKALEEERRSKWLSNQQQRLQEMKNMKLLQDEEDVPAEKYLSIIKSANTPSAKVLMIMINEFDERMEKLKKLLPAENFEAFKNDMQHKFDTILSTVSELASSELTEIKDQSFYDLASEVSTLNKILKDAETDLLKAVESFRAQFGKSENEKGQLSKNQVRLQELLDLLQVAEDESTKPNPFAKTARSVSEVLLLSSIREFYKGVERVKKLLPDEKFKLLKTDIQKEFDAISNKVNKMFSSSQLTGESDMSSLHQQLATQVRALNKVLQEAETNFGKATEMLKQESEKLTDGEISTYDSDPEKDANEKKEIESDEETLKFTNEQTESAVLDDDKLQVRIRRLERKSSDTSGKLHEMDFEQRQKLEKAVKEKLEKSGLDTGGRRIEVKIITAGYYDNEEGKDFESLTDEETDQFQNMIMALLTGQQEAVYEMKRHKKLEESYQFTWDDSEEMDSKEENL